MVREAYNKADKKWFKAPKSVPVTMEWSSLGINDFRLSVDLLFKKNSERFSGRYTRCALLEALWDAKDSHRKIVIT